MQKGIQKARVALARVLCEEIVQRSPGANDVLSTGGPSTQTHDAIAMPIASISE